MVKQQFTDRTKSLKPGIVLGVGWSVKLVLQTETQKSQF